MSRARGFHTADSIGESSIASHTFLKVFIGFPFSPGLPDIHKRARNLLITHNFLVIFILMCKLFLQLILDDVRLITKLQTVSSEMND